MHNKWVRDIGDYVVGTQPKLINATSSSYLKYLHYKITTRMYPTNKMFHAMQIKATDRCSFCEQATEALIHVLWYCPKVSAFIENVLSHIRQTYHKVIHLNIRKWFFAEDLSNIDTLITIIGKYVIHNARMNKVAPSVTAMMHSLEIQAKKEYELGKIKNNPESFKKKWDGLGGLLDRNELSR